MIKRRSYYQSALKTRPYTLPGPTVRHVGAPATHPRSPDATRLAVPRHERRRRRLSTWRVSGGGGCTQAYQSRRPVHRAKAPKGGGEREGGNHPRRPGPPSPRPPALAPQQQHISTPRASGRTITPPRAADRFLADPPPPAPRRSALAASAPQRPVALGPVPRRAALGPRAGALGPVLLPGLGSTRREPPAAAAV